MSQEEAKVFPLRLPRNFHGQQKPFKKASQVYQEKSVDRQNPQFGNIKRSNWQRKRLNSDIMKERRQFLVHPAKISIDTPEWFKTTFHFFHRNEAPVRKRQTIEEQKKFDVFNQNRAQKFAQTQNDFHSVVRTTRFQNVSNVTGKIGEGANQLYSRSTGWSMSKVDVTPKIGSVDVRDYSVRKPLIKIGQTHAHNFINTYSIC